MVVWLKPCKSRSSLGIYTEGRSPKGTGLLLLRDMPPAACGVAGCWCDLRCLETPQIVSSSQDLRCLAADDHHVGCTPGKQAHRHNARYLVDGTFQCHRVGDRQAVDIQNQVAVVGHHATAIGVL